MTVKLTSYGGAETVTGSMHLLNFNDSDNRDEVDNSKNLTVLLDAGAFQGISSYEENSYLPSTINPMNIDYIFLTHGHFDHIGRLPVLVNRGFTGQIVCTPGTRDIAFVVLDDMLKIEKGKQLERERDSEKDRVDNVVGESTDIIGSDIELDRDLEMLFTERDIEGAKRLFTPIEMDYGEWKSEDGRLIVHFLNSEHIIGSASILIEKPISLLYTGDLGGDRSHLHSTPSPIDVNNENTEKMGVIDYLIIESTYGDRIMGKSDALALQVAVEDIKKSGGRLLIPVLAVDRAEEILYLLKYMGVKEKVILDSPMGLEILDIYTRGRYLLTKVAQKFEDYGKREYQDSIHYLAHGLAKNVSEEKGEIDFKTIFKPDEFKKVSRNKESIEIANAKFPCIILASSGMLEGGRIVRYLHNVLEDSKNIVLFTSYQSEGTLGRRILDGEKEVEVKYLNIREDGGGSSGSSSGEKLEEVVRKINVKASIRRIDGVSAHADKNGLLEYIDKFRILPKKIFVVHGEKDSCNSLKDAIVSKFRVETIVSKFNTCYELSESMSKDNVVTKDVTNIDVLKQSGILKFEMVAGKKIASYFGFIIDNENNYKLTSQAELQKLLDDYRLADKGHILPEEVIDYSAEEIDGQESVNEAQAYVNALISAFNKKWISKGLIKSLKESVESGKSEYLMLVNKKIDNNVLTLDNRDLEKIGLTRSDKEIAEITATIGGVLRRANKLNIKLLTESLERVYDKIKDIK